MTIYRVPECACPTCGYKMDSATSITDNKEQLLPGDFSICMKCGEILVFKQDLTLRKGTGKDIVRLKQEDFFSYLELMRGKAAVTGLNKSMNSTNN